MNNEENCLIKKELEKQLQMLSKLSESNGLTVFERIRIANTVNTLAITLANL